ncbi:hypothetical protein ACFLXC_00910 [Chloroflexota bacterium]
MQIRKTYLGINAGLLYDEITDFVKKQGGILTESKLANYSMPTDSSSHIARGTLIFKSDEAGDKEILRVHVIGSPKTEVKLMIDIDEKLFPAEKVATLIGDLGFVFSSYEKENQQD